MLYQFNRVYGMERHSAYELSVRNNSLTCLEELTGTSKDNTNNPEFLSGFQLALEKLGVFSAFTAISYASLNENMQKSVLKLTHGQSSPHRFDFIFYYHPLSYFSPTIFSD